MRRTTRYPRPRPTQNIFKPHNRYPQRRAAPKRVAFRRDATIVSENPQQSVRFHAHPHISYNTKKPRLVLNNLNNLSTTDIEVISIQHGHPPPEKATFEDLPAIKAGKQYFMLKLQELQHLRYFSKVTAVLQDIVVEKTRLIASLEQLYLLKILDLSQAIQRDIHCVSHQLDQMDTTICEPPPPASSRPSQRYR